MLQSGVSDDSLDRISSLPKEVMDEILMRLPIRDAIKTSLLSTNWMYKWTSIPHLLFDYDSRSNTYNTDDMVKFVDRALLLHNGVISKFELDNFLLICSPDVGRWIVVLSRKGLQNLVLYFNTWEEQSKAPACLFNCETLRTLSLTGCTLSIPSSSNGLSHLTDLQLVSLTITDETFEKLLVKLPLLENLKLVSCHGLNHINVRAPNLKAVYIYGLFSAINFQNAPNLVDLSFCPGEHFMQRLEDIIRGLHKLQVVDVTYPRTKNFALDATWVELHVIYHHLTHAILHVNFDDPIQILSVILLCRSSPCLEKLKLSDCGSFGYDVAFEEPFWDARFRNEGIFHHLKSVRLEGFLGRKLELRLAQFILMNALVLETFHIPINYDGLADSEKLYVVVKISEFERASSKAKVFFYR